MNPEPKFSNPTPTEDEESAITNEPAQNDKVRSEAARQMGRSRSERKGEAARTNGQKGGRPRGSANAPATRERMKESQKRRRAEEQAASQSSPTLPIATE